MKTLNKQQVVAECREEARKVGLTFKVDHALTINGSTAYKFCVRRTGKIILSKCTLGTAYDNVCSGYIASWDGAKFQGVNHYA